MVPSSLGRVRVHQETSPSLSSKGQIREGMGEEGREKGGTHGCTSVTCLEICYHTLAIVSLGVIRIQYC